MYQLPHQQQLTPRQTGTPNSVDPNKFRQLLPNINQNMLSQLVLQARQQGIPEQEIQSGLQFINKLK